LQDHLRVMRKSSSTGSCSHALVESVCHSLLTIQCSLDELLVF